MRGVTSHTSVHVTRVTGFQLTRLMRGVTFVQIPTFKKLRISTHTPHARRDRIAVITRQLIQLFQLTRLMRGVTA